MAMQEGGCLCGAIRYSFDAEPAMVVACHCSHCRKQSGSAYSMNVAVPAPAFKLTGSLKTYDDNGASGQAVLRRFCGDCGSPIATELGALPGMQLVKAGTLDDPSWVKPGAEIWCDDKLEWSALGEELPKMPANPPFG